MTEQKYNRREFFAAVLDPLRNIRSGHHSDSPFLEDVDKAWEWTGEGITVALALTAAYVAGKDKLFTYTVTTSDPISQNPDLLNQFLRSAQTADSGVAPLFSQLQEFASVWRTAYERSRQIPHDNTYRTCTGEGDEEECTTHHYTTYTTEYYWVEPNLLTENGLNHGIIDGWNSTLGAFEGRISQLQQVLPAVGELKKNIDSYTIKTTESDQSSSNLPRMFSYGALAGAFIWYEEIGAYMMRNDVLHEVSRRKIRGFDDYRIKRRTILKLGAMALATMGIRSFQADFVKNNSSAFDNLNKQMKLVYDALDASDEQIVTNYFGVSIPDLMNYVEGMITSSQNFLEKGNESIPSWDSVKAELQATIDRAKNIQTVVSDTFSYTKDEKGTISYQIPATLLEAVKTATVYTGMQQFQGQVNENQSPPILSEVLKFGLVLTGAAAGIEIGTTISDLPFRLTEGSDSD